ncbi:MAG: alpha/beta hydrolase [candidate division Zixibacteria bacterium]|nr:alpha/beta hydrolase [candidate division Zixibacteria bacterium]
MQNLRKHGQSPYIIAAIHGGPGAPGEMAPVARELESTCGVLEPLQTATSLQGQVDELNDVLTKHGDLPITLIGYSWGAWLSYILAAKHPDMVMKLILVGSGPFEEKYAAGIMRARLDRLSDQDKARVVSALEILDDPDAEDKNSSFAQFGELLSKADVFNSIVEDSAVSETIDCQVEVFMGVWESAAELRRSGKLLEMGKQIKCPVTAIHGDYDPHPAEGVKKPLARIIKDFQFHLLEKCGHKPWAEQYARDRFYEILRKELD